MSVALLDVNVLIGLLWRPHDFHALATEWFRQNRRHGWATCPMTQSGFIRIISNPRAYPEGPAVEEAFALLNASVAASPDHHFWPNELSLNQWNSAVRSGIKRHSQITDAYLLQLAIDRGGKFVTFDRGIAQLAPEGSPQQKALVLLSR